MLSNTGQDENKKTTNIKQKLGVEYFDREECHRIFSKLGRNIDETNICAGGEEDEDSCKGDSGGPLIAKVKVVNEDKSEEDFYYLAGIVSFGSSDCGKKGVPGVYTNVAHYMNWIIEMWDEHN